MYSQRGIYPRDAWRAPHYEFEDIVCGIDSVDLVAPRPTAHFGRDNRRARSLAGHFGINLSLGVPRTPVAGRYDMLFALLSFPKDLLNFNLGRDWRDRCATSVCLIDEIWLRSIPEGRRYLRNLSQFDHIVLYYSQSVEAIGALTGRECFFLPPGIDALSFCPYPDPPDRVIDVYSLGRRSKETHRKLLEMAGRRDFFYVHDSLAGDQVIDWNEHRRLLANMAKRSRFYIVNPGLIDRPEIRGDQIEIGNRFFEGAASGCILVGEIPRNEAYENLFNWPDAVISLPFGSDRIEEIVDEFDRDPDREEALRRNNIVQALRRHDWAYRWEAILKLAELDPSPGLIRSANSNWQGPRHSWQDERLRQGETLRRCEQVQPRSSQHGAGRKMTNIAVLGTGMGGCGAAYRLSQEGLRPVMYDKNPYFGGHTTSFTDDGFLFDVGPHISYTKDERIQQLFADSVDGQYETLQIHLNNYWRGYWPTHPVQVHLHGLPDDVVVKVIADYVAEQQSGEREIRNYADWLLASFGRTFAELFPMQYTRKFHLTTAENLSTDWLGPRMYRPTLEEMLRGALSPTALAQAPLCQPLPLSALTEASSPTWANSSRLQMSG